MSNEELAVMIQSGAREKIIELWEQVRRFAWKRANRWAIALDRRGGVTDEDLVQAAFLALLDAVDSFRPESGSFLTWYNLRLKSAFTETAGLRTQRERKDPMRSAISLDAPLADDAGNSFTIADIVPDPAAQAALDDVAERERQQKLHDILEQALAQLPANQREAIIAKHYRGQQADVNAYSAAMKALRHPKVSSKLREYF